MRWSTNLVILSILVTTPNTPGKKWGKTMIEAGVPKALVIWSTIFKYHSIRTLPNWSDCLKYQVCTLCFFLWGGGGGGVSLLFKIDISEISLPFHLNVKHCILFKIGKKDSHKIVYYTYFIKYIHMYIFYQTGSNSRNPSVECWGNTKVMIHFVLYICTNISRLTWTQSTANTTVQSFLSFYNPLQTVLKPT